MRFWENVEKELNFLGKTKKELSIDAEINLQSLHKSFERQSTVSAENAVKIAKALNVTVEYLVTGKNSSLQNSKPQLTDEEIRVYRKFHDLIESCKNLSPKNIQLLKQVAESFEKE
ncbi:MAG: helix-turn-helix domain-containing protein [Treponema sp.]